MIVRSPQYLAGSRDAPCTLRIPGVCTGNGVVPCHARDDDTGGAQKASDLSVVDGCFDCHDVFDRRRKLPSGEFLSEAEWDHYALRAIQRTQKRRVDLGLLTVAGFDPNAAPKPRRAQRASKFKSGRKLQTGKRLEGRSTFQTGRKLSTRKAGAK